MKRLICLFGAAACAAALLAAARAESEKPKPLGEADVLKLVELSIEDRAIIHRLKAGGGVNFEVTDAVVERLRKAGASEAVLAALDKEKDTTPEGGKPAGKVLASGKLKSGAVLELTSIERTSEGFLMVNFRYRNPTDKPIKAWHGFAVPGDTDATEDAFSGIYYVEPKKKIKHLVAHDDAGKLVASQVMARDFLAPANETGDAFWVKMGSPGPEVDRVTFYFPNVQPIEDVPLPPAK